MIPQENAEKMLRELHEQAIAVADSLEKLGKVKEANKILHVVADPIIEWAEEQIRKGRG